MAERHRVQITFRNTGGANQSFKDEADINSIMAKYRQSGTIEHMNQRMPQYGDFDTVEDYQSAMNRVLDAQSHFAGLPSNIRDRMSNDPANLMRFMADEANLEESYNLGLRERPDPRIEDEPPAPIPDDPTPVAGGE